MYDSFYIKCPNPKCGKELEFQSKSGSCWLRAYKVDDLPPEVAIGLIGQVVSCEFCNKNITLEIIMPEVKPAKVKAKVTRKKAGYPGNYNDLPKLNNAEIGYAWDGN